MGLNACSRAFRAFWSNGVAVMLLCSCFLATLQLSVKFAAQSIPVFEVIAIRGFVSTVITIIAARSNGVRPMLGHPQHFMWLFLRTLFGTTSFTVNYFAVSLISLHENATLYFTGPVFTAIAAYLILGESIGWLAVLGMCISLVGVPLVTRPAFLFGGAAAVWDLSRILGVSLSLLAALTATGEHVGYAGGLQRTRATVSACWSGFQAAVQRLIPQQFCL